MSTSLAVGSTGSGNTGLLSKKIRVYPETQLKLKWREWINAARWCYNKAIAILKTTKIGKYDLRKKVMSDVPEWVGKTPYSPRESAIFQAFEAHKAAKKVNGETKFRRFSDQVQSIRFNKVNFRKGTFYPKQTKGLAFSSSEFLPEKMSHDPILTVDKGRWFISFVIDEKPNYAIPPKRSIALDPGVRTFLTGFDGQKFIDLGAGDIGRIYRLCCHLDNLISKAALAKGSSNKRRRFKQRKAAQRVRIKIRNLIDEAHKKISCFLTSEYQVIYLPKFETSQMVNKLKRKIRSKTARGMMNWAHYRFKMTLKHQAIKRGCFVVDVTEEYTSKTCTRCGHVHNKLGGTKKFTCPRCGHTLDRDHNGAFGIYLKALRDTSSSIIDVLYTASGFCQELPG
ncbi:MAG: transposase [Moorea sp. SIO3C2]|nr:transposase [Moorena sp. SIO3C2]